MMNRPVTSVTPVVGSAKPSNALRAVVASLTLAVLAQFAPVVADAAKPMSTPVQLVDNAPAEYVVQRGDTLWSIANKFLKNPWQWPEIWRFNKGDLRNPHKIYPGNIIRLDRFGPSLAVAGEGTLRLSPQIRSEGLAQEVPSIPVGAIAPFLTYPLVVETGAKLDDLPRVIGIEDRRVLGGAGLKTYVDGVAENEGINWQIYRPGKQIKDPETGEVLGFEANYLGEARVQKFGSPATLEITKSALEINRGDLLRPLRQTVLPSYIPRSPDKDIAARVLSVQEGVAEFGRFAVVAINKGVRDGVEIGHVLATSRVGDVVRADGGRTSGAPAFGLNNPFSSEAKPAEGSAPDSEGLTAEGRALRQAKKSGGFLRGAEVQLPNERNGLIFVFRVFDKVSYALVMQSQRQVSVGDAATRP
jgi:LysM repeat protein